MTHAITTVRAAWSQRLRRAIAWCAAFATALLVTGSALAHKASDSYLDLRITGSEVSGQWDIALRDIEVAIGLDADGDGEIRWGEVRRRHDALAAWALSSLTLAREGPCALQVTGHAVDTHTDGAYAVLTLAGRCQGSGGPVTLDYRLLRDIDTLHRGLLKLSLDGMAQAAVLVPGQAAAVFGSTSPGPLASMATFLVQGVWHIWIGLDHILFLLALLLPAVLVRRHGRWIGVPSFSGAVRDVVAVVTAFTAAHSITLSLAALGWVSLPSRWVESAIAASVVLAAANNLRPVIGGRRWMVAFGFGLIHGFGFASVLADLGLPAATLAWSLAGFNIGVELGQLAIVAAFLPLAYMLRHTGLYRQVIFTGGSWAAMVLAALWFVQRAFDLSWPVWPSWPA
jgi:hypothetical protein